MDIEHIKPSTVSTFRGILYSPPYLLMSFLMLTKCGKRVSMWTKISLTATETPLTETYLKIWNTCHGNKTDIHNEELEVGQENI